ncbi:MAG: DVU0298 family protein [Candidatus Zixiibacteriota bacterium]
MPVRIKKGDLRQFLVDGEYDRLLDWAKTVRNPQRFLMSLAYDPDPNVKWGSILAIGKVARILADDDIDKVRELIRRQLWLMNDESGGLGWSSPEIIGEILVNVPELIDEYGALLLAFLKEEPFERGSHWAVFRIASIKPQIYLKKAGEIAKSLNSSDSTILLSTVLALEKIDPNRLKDDLHRLMLDSSTIEFFDIDSGELRKTSLKETISGLIANGSFSGFAA